MPTDYTATFLRIGPKVPGVLYESAAPGDKRGVAIVAIHCEADYLDHTIGPGLAKRGYTVLCGKTHDPAESLAVKIQDVSYAVALLRKRPEIHKIILMGHSGGASLMSAYQSIAENGVKIFQGPEKVIPCPDFLEGIPAADGFLCLDSNWGNGTMTLFGTDPAVVDERGGLKLDPSLDAFNPANGWTPEGAAYSDEFLKRFFMAQHERHNRLIDFARERVAIIDAGKGFYADDEPMIIPASVVFAFNNKLFPQDPRLLCRTKEARTLVHKGGVTTNEVVRTVRHPKHLQSSASLYRGATVTTVKRFLDSWAVRTDDSYGYNDCETFGVLWDSAYCNAPGNVKHVTVPTLILGMTANWEFTAVETLFNNLASADKSCGYIEGANHDFETDKACERFEGEFGDTLETTYDYIDKWLCAPGRFL